MQNLYLSRLLSVMVLLVSFATNAALQAAGPRVFEPGERPADARLGELIDLNGYFPFQPPESIDQWEKRSSDVRQQLLVSQGLWPMPTKSPLRPVIHGLIDEEDYTVEKVYFESMPGFFVTGNLYRGKQGSERRPGVLCPHGHWANGRFYEVSTSNVRKEIQSGAERFEEGGRSPLQARCVQLARMGCVVFHYDMIGYADCTQISFELAHRFAKQRSTANAEQNWGLFSPQAESHLQSVMGLQTWNSIRALDFISQLPDVDPNRLAVTGASGGGTQTFILSAIDSRVTVSVPAVMVSTAMQGGCTCENASLLRIGTGNVEIAALFAPRPQCLLAARDWTHEMETKGFPQLQSLYKMLDAPNNVELHALLQFGHNYNHVSRAAMYRWMNQNLKLGLSEPILERDYRRLTAAELTVWDSQRPRPTGGEAFEIELLRWWNDDSRQQLDKLTPQTPDEFAAYTSVVQVGIDTIIGRSLPDSDAIEFESRRDTSADSYREIIGLLRNSDAGEELPIVVLSPQRGENEPGKPAVVWLSQNGKSGLYAASGKPSDSVLRMLENGHPVIGVDLFQQGEFLEGAQEFRETRRVENPREAASYTFGYNHSVFASRVHDVLTTIAYARTLGPSTVYLAGLDGSGPWAAAARTQAGSCVDRAAIATGGFRFAKVDRMHSPEFLPGGAKYDDLPGMLAVAAPGRLWLAGEQQQVPSVTVSCYQALSAEDAITRYDGTNEDLVQSAVSWLTGSE